MSDATHFTAGRENGSHRRPRGYADGVRSARPGSCSTRWRRCWTSTPTTCPLTVRQIFYRLVGVYGYEKTERAYARLCEYLNRARRAELIAFDDIRDDGVTIIAAALVEGTADFWDDTARRMRAYERDKQYGQPYHVELWCEAQGMMPQLARVAERVLGPGLLVRRVCVADSGAADRRARRAPGRPTVFLHVGDYDPGGESIFESMTEDASRVSGPRTDIARHSRFIPGASPHRRAGRRVRPADGATQGHRLAVRRWSGETCQLEALPPDVLAETVEAAIRGWFDLDLYAEHREFERQERIELLRALPAGNGDAEASA